MRRARARPRRRSRSRVVWTLAWRVAASSPSRCAGSSTVCPGHSCGDGGPARSAGRGCGRGWRWPPRPCLRTGREIPTVPQRIIIIDNRIRTGVQGRGAKWYGEVEQAGVKLHGRAAAVEHGAVSAGAEDDEGVLSQSEYTLTKPSSCPNHRDHVKKNSVSRTALGRHTPRRGTINSTKPSTESDHGQRNPDPSRGGGRGRRAGGRGGRGDLPGSADAEPGRPAPSGAGRAPGTAACSKHGRDHTPRRWQTGDCNVGRSSGGAGRPRRRSARGDLRLDNAFEPWHNSTDRLALSELGAVTRVRWPYRALTPRFSPLPTLPERVAARQLRRLWTPPLLWTQTTAPTGVCKTAQTRFRTATTAIIVFV